ncbi:uncharacterized protein SAPINGB_P004188 [Magnusiomyces paraingens]|uniref:Uncharacterized protein n=1 Tax=Magnusiomyces paraingens TaxID=2606893 RepID=A0A5E8BT50_9ASCO|nr:uncharacterized protein SAPINGB_P004188 [Saprochaete ingens]VVT54662.1 unnamed protein product [Saprochaete ingens]
MVGIGRGGFANRVLSPKIQANDIPDSPELEASLRVPSSPAPVLYFTSPEQTVRSGRGGYGNRIPVSKTQAATPLEYLAEVQNAASEPKTYSIGRGGAGNTIFKKKDNVKPVQSEKSFQ